MFARELYPDILFQTVKEYMKQFVCDVSGCKQDACRVFCQICSRIF